MTVLRSNPINESGVNFDSDQDIMGHTQTVDGKWRFYEGDKLIAEAQAPAEPSMATVEEWCAAVRARTKRELDADDAARRDAARSKGGIVGANGKPVSSRDNNRGSRVEPVEDEVEDPNAWIDEKVQKAEARLEAVREKEAELVAQVQAVGLEAEEAAKALTKWTKLKGAMEEDG